MRFVKSLALAATAILTVPAYAADPIFTALPTESGRLDRHPEWQCSGWPLLSGCRRHGFRRVPVGEFSARRNSTAYSPPDEGLSISFVEQSSFTIGVVGRFLGGRYLQDNRRLYGLEKIDWAVEPGVFVEYWPFAFLRARAELRHGINGHDGFVADFGVDVVQRYGAFTFSVGPRLALGDSSFTRTYFGVTPYEAAVNGLVTPYRPGGGITSVGVTSGLTYDWSDQWSTTGFVTYRRLVGDPSDSPIVKRFGSENQVGLGLTVSYSFDSGM